MPRAYHSADVVWHPTIAHEPLGLVPIEAMAAGTPIIASTSGGIVETVENAESGLLVPRNDPNALARATERLLREPHLRTRLVRGGLVRARRFDLDGYIDKLTTRYERMRFEEDRKAIQCGS
jgi:D-inositol-3-phosphate glycosyltransferase